MSRNNNNNDKFGEVTGSMILFSHPTGNANVREAARAMNEAGLLSEFWTSVSWNQERLLNRVLPRSMTREFERRAFPHISRRQLHHHPWVEFGRLAARQLNLASLLRHEVGRLSVDAVYRSLDSRVADRLCDGPHFRGVYAYEDGALVSFRAARQLGIKTIYELPIGYWRCHRDLMQEEASRQPEWAATLLGSGDSDEKLRRKDDELALATDIVVSSDFVRSTLRNAGPLQARVSVLPYGAPPANATPIRKNTREGKLKVLFVGALSQRKGLSYLLQAVTRLGGKIELTMLGRRVAECRPVDEALRTHRWIPSLPHDTLLEEMSHHDVMVFPSLFEGCALVVLEAMSQGLPVIATPNTGAAHFISHGNDGFLVPIRDAEAIVNHLQALLLDGDRLVAMSHAAKNKAAQHCWQHYRQRLVSIVRRALTEDAAEAPVMSESRQPEGCPSC